ncbi:MAG TPA: hypothetical protein VN679_11495 [Candidatus Acidoferrales bacterium]|jgi:hypothetical protein|nr:hypothetical protein [Candidatus Acidoferrales bacterium]
MKRVTLFACLFFTGFPVFAAPLATNARAVIPFQVQQIINVDYRRMKNSDSAMQMKAKLTPPNMKQFEDALKNVGISVDKDIDQITLAAFRTKTGLQTVGIAQGIFARKKILLRIRKQGVKAKKLNNSFVYPMSGGMVMTFLDENTMLFGDQPAVQASLNARDDSSESLNANSNITDMISSVDTGTLWSVLDAEGTQTMMKGALGTASSLAEFDDIKKRLTGSRYTVDFDHGVDFNLNVVTSDTMTAATLASVLKAGMMYRKMNATPSEKTAIDDTNVDSDAGKLVVHFKADDKSFQSLLDSPMFAAVTR